MFTLYSRQMYVTNFSTAPPDQISQEYDRKQPNPLIYYVSNFRVLTPDNANKATIYYSKDSG
jgi:hypothetical protein